MKSPRSIAGVVFDMDGLLFDTETLYGEAIAVAIDELGYEMAPRLYYRMVGNTWRDNERLLRDHYGLEFPTDELKDAWSRQFNSLSDRLSLKPGVLELLETLDELNLPRAIATSSRREVAHRHLAAHNLVDRFHKVIARGDYANSKPSPDPFLKAAECLGLHPQDCLALEDSPNGIQSASSAGMITIMVPDLLEPTQEIRRLCSFIVPDLRNVRQLLLAGEIMHSR